MKMLLDLSSSYSLMGVYLPFLSPQAKAGEQARREMNDKSGRASGEASAGSMWNNIDRAAKQNKQTRSSNSSEALNPKE